MQGSVEVSVPKDGPWVSLSSPWELSALDVSAQEKQ